MGDYNLTALLASFSPAKRALLEFRLKEKGLESSVSPIIPRTSSRDSAPLSFAQERLWFLNQPEYDRTKAVAHEPTFFKKTVGMR